VSERLLDQKILRRAFELLAKHLKRRGVVGEVHVFGGAAMVLAFNSRQATRDVDAVFAPDTYVLEAAREVADELGLPKSWLNNQASSYVSGVAGRGTPVFDHANLRVMVTPIEHLLAMKVRAARAVRDADDIRVLLNELKITKMSQVIAVVNKYIANEPLSVRSSQLLEDILST